MNDDNLKDATILMLAERLYICSRLLTRAAEKLQWDVVEVQELVVELRQSIKGYHNASIQEDAKQSSTE